MSTKQQIQEERNEHNQDVFEKHLALILEKNGTREAKKIINSAHIADLAGFLNKANSFQKEKVLGLLSDQQISDLVVELDEQIIPVIVEMLGSKKSSKIIDSLDIDDAIYVLDSLEDDLEDEILNHLKSKKQKELKEGLSYPEGSAGRLMQKKYISVPETWTIKQVIEHIQSAQNQDVLPEVFHEIFITNAKYKPVGSVPLSLLFSQSKEASIASVMNKDITLIKTDLEEEEVAYLFKKYSYVAVPVVTKHNRLIGVITLEDAMEIINRQAEENIMHMGGVKEDDFYLGMFEVVKSRFPWLLLSLVTAIMCSLVVNFFHDTIQQAVILSAVMPIVSGISGNAGTQTMTITVLSLSSKELTALNVTRVILKQIVSCSCNGIILAIFGGLILSLLYHDFALSLIFGLAVTINFALAGFLGAVIPIFLNKSGFDPAVASPVFVTTLIDILSFAIFLSLATQILL